MSETTPPQDPPQHDTASARDDLQAALDSLQAHVDEISALVTRALDDIPVDAATRAHGRAPVQRNGRDRALLDALARHAANQNATPLDQQLEALRASDLFDDGWYLRTYPDVAETGIDPAQHYATIGAFEGRRPGPDFDTVDYYTANPDVFMSGWPALVHYHLFGMAEHRPIEPVHD